MAYRVSPHREKIGEEHRKVDHPAAPVLGRPEVPMGMHVLMHRTKLRIDLVDSPAHTEPCRLRAK